MEARNRVEGGPDDASAGAEVVVDILIGLDAEEDRAEENRRDQPECQAALVALGNRPRREVHPDAARYQDNEVDGAQRLVYLSTMVGKVPTRADAQVEVRREEVGEEDSL